MSNKDRYDYASYDDFLKHYHKDYYKTLIDNFYNLPKDILPRRVQMEEARDWFASKGVNEITEGIVKKIGLGETVRKDPIIIEPRISKPLYDDKATYIEDGLKQYFTTEYVHMNRVLRETAIALASKMPNKILYFDDFFDEAKKNAQNKDIDRHVSENMDRYIFNTLDAIKRAIPSKKPFYVYRCYKKLVDVDRNPVYYKEDGNTHLNTIIYVDQFLSTSILLRAADFHCSPFDPFSENKPLLETSLDNTIIRILIPPETRGIALVYYNMLVTQSNDIGKFSEFEYLLPPGSILTLTNAKEDYSSVVRKELIHKYYDGKKEIKTVFKIPTYVYSCPIRPFPDISRPEKQDTKATTDDNRKADSYWKKVAKEEIAKVLKVGDSVEVRTAQEPNKWIHAKVTSTNPLEAKPYLWPNSFPFKRHNIRRYEYKIGDSVEVKTSEQSDRWVPGKVTSINPLEVKLDSLAKSFPFEPHNMRLYEYKIGESVEVKTVKNPDRWIHAKVTTTDPLLVKPDHWTEALSFEHHNMRPMPPSFMSRIKSNIGKVPSFFRRNRIRSDKLGGKIKRRKQTRKQRKQRKQTRKGKKKFTQHK